jgi:hypothetical protein
MAENIARLGGIIVSPLPLKPGQSLRFHIAQDAQSALLQRLQTWGHDLACCGVETRFMPVGHNHLPMDVNVYELRLPADRPAEPTKKVA